jgi:hypothetical protein
MHTLKRVTIGLTASALAWAALIAAAIGWAMWHDRDPYAVAGWIEQQWDGVARHGQ